MPEQQITRQAGRKLFVRKLVPDTLQKNAKQRQKRMAQTTCRIRANFTHQGFKPRPIQNHLGVVLTMERRVIKHWAANKPRWFGHKGISHDMNIINLSPISETDAEG